MACVGIKLGRHSVQAALWSENAGHPVEAHLPGLEVESAWHPTLGRDSGGKLIWGEDLWSRLHEVEPLPDSVPEKLGGGEEYEGLLGAQLWPEVLRLAEKELRGDTAHRVAVVLTVEPTPERREALARSLPPELALAEAARVAPAALLAARSEAGEELHGRVLQVHLGGAEAQMSLWDAQGSGALQEVRRGATREASVGAVLECIYARLIGEWGLLRLEEPASEAERAQLERLRRHGLRRLAESRSTWRTAWQYEPPPDFRHLARWMHAGPAPLPAAGIEAALSAASEALDRELDALLEDEQVDWVVPTGAGASASYLLTRLHRRFGRKRFRRLRPESLPALGAAVLARGHGEPVLTRALNLPTAPARASQPSSPPPSASGPVGLGLSLSADTVAIAWCRGDTHTAEVVSLQGRFAVPAAVALDRDDPRIRHWGPRAELLLPETERFAVVRAVPSHIGSGVRFVISRKGSRATHGATAEELYWYLVRETTQEAIRAVDRLVGAAPEGLVYACRAPWAAETAGALGGSRARYLDPCAAAWISAVPGPESTIGAVLLVEGDGLTAGLVQRAPSAFGGWETTVGTEPAGYGASFASEVLARFLTDELNARCSRSYRYVDLQKAAPGSENRQLGDALSAAGEELAASLVRRIEAAQRFDAPLPGGGTARFEVQVHRDHWERWAGKRIREAAGRALSGVLKAKPARLILAGGGAVIPLFGTAAEALCAPLGVTVELHPQPETAVALGAAVAAAGWVAAVEPSPDLLIAASPNDRIIAEAIAAAAAQRGLGAALCGPDGVGDPPPRALVVLGGELGVDSVGQEVAQALRNGVPVLPLLLERVPDGPGPAATSSLPPSLETLSEADRSRVVRLLDRVRRLFRSEEK